MSTWRSPGPAAAFLFMVSLWFPIILFLAISGEPLFLSAVCLFVVAWAILFSLEARTRVQINPSNIVLQGPVIGRVVMSTEEVEVSWSPGNLTKGISPYGRGAAICIREPRGRGGCVEVHYIFPFLELLARRKIERIVGYSITQESG